MRAMIALALLTTLMVIPALQSAPVGSPPTTPVAALATTSTATTIPAGSYIIDMGQSTQTVANSLLPYGLVYELMIKDMVPVDWVINDNKSVDGTDFSYAGKAYKGGPFIIDAAYAAQAQTSITAWQKKGVVIDGPTTAPITVPVRQQLTNWPNALLDGANGSIAQAYYTAAGIPASITNGATGQTKTAYQFMAPTDPRFLNNCYDLYAMPHADPTYATHHPLKQFNAQGGYIWAGCHAVSAMENIRDPQGNLDLNFLTTNGLTYYKNHKGATLPFVRSSKGGDPVNQFLGTTAGAQTNGSEDIYVPGKGSAWNPDATLIETDPTQADVLAGNSPGPAAADVYGRGFGNAGNGMVMYQSGHSLSGTAPDNVAAIRAFLNFNLLAGIERGLAVTTHAPATIVQNTSVPVSATISGGATAYTYQWVSSCGGTFDVPSGSLTRAGTSVTVSATFTAPGTAQGCSIKLSVVDSCGRTSFGSSPTTVVALADLSITKTDDKTVLQAGKPDSYTLTITNNGPGTATPVSVNDPWPSAYLIYGQATPSQGSCSFDGTAVSCALGTMAPGATATITISATSKATANGTITNTATVSAPQSDPTPGNNTATDTTRVEPNGLHLVKTASPSSVDTTHGAVPVTFTFTVSNSGPNTLTDIAVTDTDIAGCSPAYKAGDTNCDKALQTSETWTYTCTTPVSQTMTNHATATATDPVLGPISATAQAKVTAISPSIAITKVAEQQPAAAGGEVVFDITVKNTGSTDLADVQVTDPKTPACDRFLGTMPQGTTITYSCSLNPAPTAGTSDTNTINVVGTPPGGSTVTDTSTAPYATTARDLTITKKPVDCATHTPLTKPAYDVGDQVCYEIDAKNTSTTTTEHNIVLTDNLPAGVANPTTTWSTSNYDVPTPIVAKDTFDEYDGLGSIAWGATTPASPAWTEVGDDNKTQGGGIRATNTSKNDGSAKCAAGDDCVLWMQNNNRAIGFSGSYSSYSSCAVTFDYEVARVNGSDTVGIAVGYGGTTLTGPPAWPTAAATNAIDGTTVASSTVMTSWKTATVKLPAGPAGTSLIGFRGTAANNNDTFFVNNVSITCYTPYHPANTAGTTRSPTIIAATDGIDLYPGQRLTAYVAASVTAAGGVFPRQLVNVAGIGSDQQSTPSQATATVDRVIPALAIVKSADQASVEPGTAVTYTFTVTNTGNDPLSSVSVVDKTMPACSPTRVGGDTDGDNLLDLTETWTYTCTVAVTQAITNVAVANGTSTTSDVNGATPPAPQAQGAAPVEVVRSGIAVVKKADQSTVYPGTPVTYTYLVTLASGDTEPLTGVYITDDKCTSVTGPSMDGGNQDGSLDAGETWSYTCTQPLTTTTTNTVTAYGVDRLGTQVTASDQRTVKVIQPAISIVKTASPTTIAPGTAVTFTMKVTNTGNDPLRGVVVTDDQCSPISDPTGDDGDGVLAPGETWRYTCTKTISADTTNTAAVQGTDSLGGQVTASSSASVDVQAPSIELVKSVDQPVVHPGTTVTYTMIAINDGDLALSSVAVVDDTCSPLTGPFAGSAVGAPPTSSTLAPGDKWFYTCSKAIDADTTNTASVTAVAALPSGGTQTVRDSAQADVRIYDPLLKVTKTASATKVDPGTSVTYTYTVSNVSSCPGDGDLCLDDNVVNDLSVSDDRCSPVVATVDATGADIGDTGRPDGSNAVGALDVGETWTYTCTTVITSPTTNTVTAGGADVLGDPVTPVTAQAFVDTTVAPTLAVVKSGPATATIGETVTYTFAVTNTTSCLNTADPAWCFSASYVADPAISDDVTRTPTYVSGDDGNGRIDVGETWTYASTYVVKASDLSDGVTNHVSVTGTDRDGDAVGPATDSHHLDVIGSPQLQVSKQVTTIEDSNADGRIDTGDTIVYTLTVANTGDIALSDVTVADPNATVSGGPVTLAVGASDATTFVGRHLITAADMDAGQVVNQARANADSAAGPTSDLSSDPTRDGDGDGDPTDEADEATVTPLTQQSGITLAKSASFPIGNRVGDTIYYSFLVTNTCTVTLHDVVVKDARVDTVSCPSTTLAAFAQMTCTATYALTAADVAAGEVDNTATATGTPPDTGPITSDPSSTRTAVPLAMLPFTGGSGRRPYVVVGAALLLISGLFLLVGRRPRRKGQRTNRSGGA